VRLFCLPFAGGGASVFRLWGKDLAPTVEVCPVQIPGRESRLAEPPYTDIRPLAQSLVDHIRPYTQKPFALFGHSMGALVAFELTRMLQRQNGSMPIILLLSAHRAAHLPMRWRPFAHLPGPEFIQRVRDLGGTPDGVFESQDLIDIILPTLRADFTL